MKKNNKSIKGAKLRQMGYPTSIHALPVEMKMVVDSMLGDGSTITEVMKQLKNDNPSTPIPSRSAFYNYKRKYFNPKPEDGVLDIKDLAVKPILLEHIKRFLAFDLPTLRDNYQKSIDQNKQNPASKEVRDSTKLYFEGIKLALDSVSRLNLNYSESDTGSMQGESSEAIDHDIEEIVRKYGKELIIASRNQAS